jgi:TRAP-type C4-dicarboxylate transport system substrate-binding protein
MRLLLALLLGALVLVSVASAEPITLRMATVAPEGSAWARVLRSYARDVETESDGTVRIKLYLGGIAGDEMEVLARIKREQLDGTIGSEICTRLAPSMKVARIVGLFQSREESAYALSRLKPILDQEFLQSGFINLGEAGLGTEVFFTRQPVRSLADLHQQKLWIWDLDEMLRAQVGPLGLTTLPLPINEAARAYDEQRIDGFVAIPTGTLAFQWSAQARYVIDLRMTFRSGCQILSSRAYDELPINARTALNTASGKLARRVEDLGVRQDQELLGGLLARQGVKTMPVSETLRAEFFEAARVAREQAGNQLVPRPLLEKVLSWLADYRALHQLAR